MTRHVFQPSRYYNTFATHEPALYIADGDEVETTTVDASGHDGNGEAVARGGNPLTGPFWVEGAEPGDMISVRIDHLRPNRTTGYGRAMLAANTVDPDFVVSLDQGAKSSRVDWSIDLKAATTKLIDPPAGLDRLVLQLEPMIGCIGVAPSHDQALTSATSGDYGGNMDYRGVAAGAVLYFPVFAPGGLLFVGDCHALQGDGEMSGTGIEVSADLTFTVGLHKGVDLRWPRGESATHRFTLGNARPLDQAVQHATTEMVRWLRADFGLSASAAGLLMSQSVEYDLGNMYDPAYTMVCKMPKRVLSMLRP